MTTMDLNNPPKFYLLLITLLGVFALMLFGRIEADNAQAWALIGSIVGYGVGNGIAARQGQPVEPVFRARARRDSGRIRFELVAGWTVVIVGVVTSALCAAYLINAI